MPNAILFRYGEIAIKGGNRAHFENILKESIYRQVGGRDHFRIDQTRGRLFLRRRDRGEFAPEQIPELTDAMQRVFGLTSFSFVHVVPPAWDAIVKLVTDNLEAAVGDAPLPRGYSFRIRSRRSDKEFPMTTHEVDMALAEIVTARYPGIAVDLSNAADLTIGVEIRNNRAAVYFDSVPGPGGLPVGSAESALALLSAGIDSPVASWQTMKRGCYLDFLTFHSAPYTPPETVHAVADLVLTLNKWQRNGALIACNLAEAQKVIRDGCTERFRTILYRRLMMRVAQELAGQLGNHALVTGEAVGQVASQTITNMHAIDDATDMLVLRPLVTYDKMEITPIARRIGTLDVSERGCADSCTVFAPSRAVTNAKVDRLREEEARLDYPALMQLARDGLRRIDPVTYREYPFVPGRKK